MNFYSGLLALELYRLSCESISLSDSLYEEKLSLLFLLPGFCF